MIGLGKVRVLSLTWAKRYRSPRPYLKALFPENARLGRMSLHELRLGVIPNIIFSLCLVYTFRYYFYVLVTNSKPADRGVRPSRA